jgi:hypothetical protein
MPMSSFGGLVCQQTIGISMGTSFAPILVELLLHASVEDFLQILLNNKHRQSAQIINSSSRYIDNGLPVTEQFSVRLLPAYYI